MCSKLKTAPKPTSLLFFSYSKHGLCNLLIVLRVIFWGEDRKEVLGGIESLDALASILCWKSFSSRPSKAGKFLRWGAIASSNSCCIRRGLIYTFLPASFLRVALCQARKQLIGWTAVRCRGSDFDFSKTLPFGQTIAFLFSSSPRLTNKIIASLPVSKLAPLKSYNIVIKIDK